MTADNQQFLSTWQPIRGPFTRWPRSADAALAIIVLLLLLFLIHEEADGSLTIRSISNVSFGELLTAAVASACLYWRRTFTLTVLGIALVATALSTGFDYSEFIGVSMMVALYSVGRYVSNDQSSFYGVGVALIFASINSLISGESISDFGSGLIIVFLTWYIGRRLQLRVAYLRLLQERAERLEMDQEEQARRAVVDERTRIARELHDVVAHQVSLMTVQAGAAKTIVTDDSAGAIQAMEAVENAGRQALDELRHLMGVLRPNTEVEELNPQRGIADIPRIVKNLRDAGLDVSLTVNGTKTDLPIRVDISAYRIVQEALTNVLKHAGSNVQVEVLISIGRSEVTIQVTDNGQNSLALLPGTGHGITGMHERAQLLGGTFTAEQRPGGGFQVVSSLPFKEAI